VLLLPRNSKGDKISAFVRRCLTGFFFFFFCRDFPLVVEKLFKDKLEVFRSGSLELDITAFNCLLRAPEFDPDGGETVDLPHLVGVRNKENHLCEERRDLSSDQVKEWLKLEIVPPAVRCTMEHFLEEKRKRSLASSSSTASKSRV
jgi:hypothetical protein